MDVPTTGHDPVLLEEVIQWLQPNLGRIFVDCTLGRGGHALAIAQQLDRDGELIGLDVDPRNLDFSQKRLQQSPCTVRLFHANFAELDEVLAQAACGPVDGILADLGLSTNQLFDAGYGLSFSQDMNLDMRLDPRTTDNAADLVNSLP